jgi:hypothetical protein
LISYYDRVNLVSFASDSDVPSFGNPFGLGTLASLNFLNSSITSLNPAISYFGAGPYQFTNFVKSNEISTKFYYTVIYDRNELINKMELRSYNLSTQTETRHGFVSDISYGDTNTLSNLTPLYKDSLETVFGVSSGYLPNPVKKTNSKNYLFKYDKYLSGIIELADFTGMKIWDALTQLAKAFNFIMGFDNDAFYFIPKTLSTTPDIFLDLDIDPVISWEKIQDVDIKNVITSTPYVAKKGNIEWNITNCANVTETRVDDGRIPLDAALRIRQEDDLSHQLVLKTVSSGQIPNVPGEYKVITAGANGSSIYTT